MSVSYALLALLAGEPKFGQRLKDEFEENTGNIWPLNVGQVYTTLARLERDGFVHALEDGQSSQKLYKLTQSGRAELHEWFATPPSLDVPPRDEVVIKVMLAMTVEGVDLTTLLQTHRRRLLETMQHFTKLKRNDDDLALELVVDAELFRLEATVRWVDACESRLKRKPRLSTKQPIKSTTETPKESTSEPKFRSTSAGVRR